MLFTRQFAIGENGETRLGTIGGSPFVQDSDGKDTNKQVGFTTKCRYGIIRVDSAFPNQPAIFDCRIEVQGYYNKIISNAKAPGRIIVELPASVTVFGPPGTTILVEAWEFLATADRGACQSVLSASGISVPDWASSFDLSAPSVATFRDNANNIVGIVTGTVVNFSIPSLAATVDVTGDNTCIVFRQQG